MGILKNTLLDHLILLTLSLTSLLSLSSFLGILGTGGTIGTGEIFKDKLNSLIEKKFRFLAILFTTYSKFCDLAGSVYGV
jgi:hypothetical protein